MSAAVSVSRHPLVLDKLTRLRAVETPPEVFRLLVRDLTQLLLYETLADLYTVPHPVSTPLEDAEGVKISERVGFVPILRAGLGMVDPALDMLPEAAVWHLGIYRDHDTLRPHSYYNKLPDRLSLDIAVVLDPMLATGGSAIAAIDTLKGRGVPRIKFLGLIAAPEGVNALSDAHPDVAIHVAHIDARLNSIGYIVPGLGDAGDRQFATV